MVTCFNCSKEGHASKDCSEPRKKVDWSKVQCTACREYGHSYKRCPAEKAAEDGSEAGDAGAAGGDDYDAPVESSGGW